MVLSSFTAQKMKFSITDFFSKCEQIRSFLRIWSHLLMKSLMDNFIFCAVFELVNIKQELRMPSSNKIYKFITLLVGKISSIKHVNNKTGKQGQQKIMSTSCITIAYFLLKLKKIK